LRKNQEKLQSANFYTWKSGSLDVQKLLPPFTKKFLLIDITIPSAQETNCKPVITPHECRIHVDQTNFSSFGFSFPTVFGYEPK
jgi:hypothetical protein